MRENEIVFFFQNLRLKEMLITVVLKFLIFFYLTKITKTSFEIVVLQ